MKKFACAAIACAAVFSLAGCGSSNDATEQASPDNVEIPAEDAVNTVEAVPVPDSGATATAPADPNAGAKPEDAAANAAAAARDFEAAGGNAAEPAIDQAEKKTQ